MIIVIKQKILNTSKATSQSLQKLLHALNANHEHDTSFEDYKFTIFYKGRSAIFFAREFRDASMPCVFSERRVPTNGAPQLSDPEELKIKDLLIPIQSKDLDLSYKIERACLTLLENELSSSGRYNDMMAIGGIPRTEALRYCMFEKIYPEIDFFKMPAKNLKVALTMYYNQELQLNLHNREILLKATITVNKRMRPPKNEFDLLCDRFGRYLAEEVLGCRIEKRLKFYQLDNDILEKLIVCENKEYDKYRFVFNQQDIRLFDRLIDALDDKNVIGLVFKKSDNSEKAIIVNVKTKECIPFIRYLEQQCTDEKINNGFSLVTQYNNQVVQDLSSACEIGLDEFEIAEKCKHIIAAIDCRYMLTAQTEKIIQSMEKRIEFLEKRQEVGQSPNATLSSLVSENI